VLAVIFLVFVADVFINLDSKIETVKSFYKEGIEKYEALPNPEMKQYRSKRNDFEYCTIVVEGEEYLLFKERTGGFSICPKVKPSN
jgi:hypothetical protein